MQYALTCHIRLQARGVFEALEVENKTRSGYAAGSDIIYALEDLKLGASGNLMELSPGRRILLTLGNRYRAVLLDAQELSDQYLFHCAVFLVPKVCNTRTLFTYTLSILVITEFTLLVCWHISKLYSVLFLMTQTHVLLATTNYFS